MNRRTFLKMAGVGSIAFAAGCTADPENNLFTLVKAPDDMVTGRGTWYASTCRECPAGCGVIAQNREARVIKLEGNPYHPVNRGRLCMRGQAALQAVYHPDRLGAPLRRQGQSWHSLSYAQALDLLRAKAFQAAERGRNRVRMLTEVSGKTLTDVFARTLSRFNSPAPVVFEPFAFETLKFAHRQVFGRPVLPAYRMDQADLLISFGADFLETWLSPVEYARKFKAMHAIQDGRKAAFVHISPFMSLTGANADRWLNCHPGSEAAVALGLIRQMLAAGHGSGLAQGVRRELKKLADDYTAERVAELSGVAAGDLNEMARRLLAARRPLVLGTATANEGGPAAAADLAATLLNAILDPALHLYDFDQRHRVEVANTRAEVLDFWTQMEDPAVELLLIHHANPVFTLPSAGQVRRALERDDLFVVVFADFMDETAALADLVLPAQMALETWDAYESKQAMVSTLQPVRGRTGWQPSVGDFFLNLTSGGAFKRGLYKDHLIRQMAPVVGDPGNQWLQTIQNGGRFVAGKTAQRQPVSADGQTVKLLTRYARRIPTPDRQQIRLQAVPSIRFFDGRGANRPWLCEIPDPLTKVAWQAPVMVHPELMKARGWRQGDRVTLDAAGGHLQAPVYAYEGLHPRVVAVAIGQGHTGYGRYAKGKGANPLALLAAATDEACGAGSCSAVLAAIKATGQKMALAHTDGSRVQHNRKIALSVELEKLGRETGHDKPGLAMHDFPFTLPTPEGYDHRRDIYPAHAHDTYRWGMVVDLDRCIGCNACAAACYAENNIGVVGEQRILEGREMSWMRIERYEAADDGSRLTFLPMMCQHCDNAPCESVCPVYAPHHSKEGINNQIYNRCIGTRFCAQNCPYKVRRFNWYDWQWPKPLDQQLNPRVTVRSKGVMEKCSFCIQRIKAAHDVAKNEKRKIRDGEVTPACVQTCPTGALTFGSFMDAGSRIRKLIKDPRAYQVMGYLNTKPAVIYLKKVVQTI